MHETLNRSSLSRLRVGSAVNLERAMPATGRFGGHIVAGHVDGVGSIDRIRRDANAVWFTILARPEILRYVVEKGSITIDGISLTVATVDATGFSVSTIPHTLAHTNLGTRRRGDLVNLEADIVGKYIEKLLRPMPGNGTSQNGTAGAGSDVTGASASSGITRDMLTRYGF